MGDDDRAPHGESVERGGDAVGLGRKGVVSVLGARRRADAEWLHHDDAVPDLSQERYEPTVPESRADQARH